MRKTFRILFSTVIALMGMTIVAGATPVACTNQAVVIGLTCSEGNLTFDFFNVSFDPGSVTDRLSIETPPTSAATPDVVTLGFQILSTYPVDINIDYLVTSSSSDISAIGSTFGPPAAVGSEIFETACATNPTIVPPGCAGSNIIATVTNSTGEYTVTPSFGPLSQIYIDKDISDYGFSEFTDSVQETSAAPEPATSWFLGCAVIGLAVLAPKLRFR
jgi:hypothetical protein